MLRDFNEWFSEFQFTVSLGIPFLINFSADKWTTEDLEKFKKTVQIRQIPFPFDIGINERKTVKYITIKSAVEISILFPWLHRALQEAESAQTPKIRTRPTLE